MTLDDPDNDDPEDRYERSKEGQEWRRQEQEEEYRRREE